MQDGGGRRPHGAHGDTGQHHHIGGKRPQAAQSQNQQDGRGGEQERQQRRGEGADAHPVVGQVVAGGEKAAGKGDDGQIGAEHRRVGHAQRRRGGHGIAQRGLHDETRDGQSRPGDERCQQTGDADVPDDPRRRTVDPTQQGIEALCHGHVGRAYQHAGERGQRHRDSQYDEHRRVFPRARGLSAHMRPPPYHKR